MADALGANMKASVEWILRETLDLSTVVDASSLSFAGPTSDGTGENQADKIWHDTRTLAASAVDNLDLTSLTYSLFGGTITVGFVKIRGLLVVNKSAVSGDKLTLGGGSNAFVGPLGSSSHTLSVPSGSAALLTNLLAGWTVTGGSQNMLRIANSGAGGATYDIVIVGTSA